MRVLVTGAAGFVGTYVVSEALRRGDAVRAAVRPGTSDERMPWRGHPALEWVVFEPRRLDAALRDVDAVVHLAALKHGDLEAQRAVSVETTRALLEALGARRLVVLGSLSVFDYLALEEGACLDEDTPLEPEPARRGAYAHARLLQERLLASAHEADVTLLRAGTIWGRGSLWNARLGVDVGGLRIRIGRDATLPLVYVENCAQAIVEAAHRAGSGVFHLVDDDLPSQQEYLRQLRERSAAETGGLGIGWPLARALARLAAAARLPLRGVLDPAELHARFKPLRYSNRRARQGLGWQPRYSLAEALDRACGDTELPEPPTI